MAVKRLSSLIFIGGLLLLSACKSQPAGPPPPTAQATTSQMQAQSVSPTATSVPLAALVNGEPLPLAEYERQIASYEASMAAAGQDPSTPEGQATLAKDRQWILDRLIEQMLIEQAARQAGLTVDDAEVDADIQSLRQQKGDDGFQQWLQQEGMTEAQLRETMKHEMLASKMINQVASSVPTHTEHIHARHILVNTEAEAQQLLAQLQSGADFATLARTYSQDTSTRDKGGDLGFFPRGGLTSPEVEEAAFALQPGQISGVVHSSLGYHIIQVIAREPDMELSPDNLRRHQESAVQQWIDSLWAQADIKRYVTN